MAASTASYPDIGAMEKVIAYVDGFNLYYGLRAKGWSRYLWLDLPKLCTSLVRPSQRVTLTKYFTARISGPPDSVRRQAMYIDALLALGGIEVFEGKFLPRDGRCRKCGHTWPDYEEKQTDVNIAVQMMRDAHFDRFDMALLISGDGDLAPAVAVVRETHAGKKIVVASPPGRRSDTLNASADAAFPIGRAKIAACQLPGEVRTASGHVLLRPAKWS
jgi:hypothetical protein